MKKFLITFLVLTIGATSVFAQRLSRSERNFRSHSPWKYELRLGYGGFPSYDRSNFLSSRWTGYYFYEPAMPRGYNLDNLYGSRALSEYVTGVFSGEFSIHYKRWLSFAINLGVNGMWSNMKDPSNGQYVERGVSFNLTPMVRFYYLNKPLVRLYSGGGVGLYAGFYEGKEYVITPSFHITPIGVTVGRQVFFFAETALSTAAVGGNFGIGYRF